MKKTPSSKGIQKVKVDYKDCEFGLITLTLKVGNQITEIIFNEEYDPIPELIKWLETICNGAKEAVFQLEKENKIKLLRISKTEKEEYEITIIEKSEKNISQIKRIINPLELVKEFYKGLKKFAKTKKYRKHQWESETYGEWFSKIADTEQEEIIKLLIPYKSETLQKMLPEPGYWNILFGNQNKTETGNYFQIPNEYDSRTSEQKEQFLKECFNKNINGHKGTPLGNIKSEVIENYLKKQSYPL
ncbi:MAG: hypothetical protein WC223_05015 [Bacteroidales bacterium]|jgi:hypothetical protein